MWLDEEIEDVEEDCGVENLSGRSLGWEQDGEELLSGLGKGEDYKMAKMRRLR